MKLSDYWLSPLPLVPIERIKQLGMLLNRLQKDIDSPPPLDTDRTRSNDPRRKQRSELVDELFYIGVAIRSRVEGDDPIPKVLDLIMTLIDMSTNGQIALSKGCAASIHDAIGHNSILMVEEDPGYNATLLAEHGISIQAFSRNPSDQLSLDGCSNTDERTAMTEYMDAHDGHPPVGTVCYPLEKARPIDAVKQHASKDTTLFMSSPTAWPVEETIRAYRSRGGEHLMFIGEREANVPSTKVWTLLDREWIEDVIEDAPPIVGSYLLGAPSVLPIPSLHSFRLRESFRLIDG